MANDGHPTTVTSLDFVRYKQGGVRAATQRGTCIDRQRILRTFKAEQRVSDNAELPIFVLPTDADPQLCTSRNSVPQPFYLICHKDTVVVQVAGFAEVTLKDSSGNQFLMTVGDHVYVPAGTPHRVVPSEESIQLRYQGDSAGLESIAWYCPGCDRQLHRSEWDTTKTVSQAVYDACLEFNNDETLRHCRSCGALHARIDFESFAAGKTLVEQLRAGPQS